MGAATRATGTSPSRRPTLSPQQGCGRHRQAWVARATPARTRPGWRPPRPCHRTRNPSRGTPP
eukprot:4859993-Lingulodinium_polyedra.AAC.1